MGYEPFGYGRVGIDDRSDNELGVGSCADVC
jgi:hypothetical protein